MAVNDTYCVLPDGTIMWIERPEDYDLLREELKDLESTSDDWD
jgi:putative hemolysin